MRDKRLKNFMKIARSYRNCKFKKQDRGDIYVRMHHSFFTFGTIAWKADIYKLTTEADIKIFLNEIFIEHYESTMNVDYAMIKTLRAENKKLLQENKKEI